MRRRVTITLSADEAEIILGALETDREIYLQSARDAVADGSRELAVTLGNAADRICAFRTRLQRELIARPLVGRRTARPGRPG